MLIASRYKLDKRVGIGQLRIIARAMPGGEV
jgi:hypothetical protein